jgi:two-component system sensor histidine kinase SenX3
VSELGLFAAAAGGLLLGILGCLLWSRRRPNQRPESDDDRSATADAGHALLALQNSTTGHAVLDLAGRVLFANPRSFQLGVVRAGLPDRKIAAAAARAAVSADPVDVELLAPEPPTGLTGSRRSPISVQAVVRSIGYGKILVSATDETETMRLEEVRRDFVANVSHELKTPVAAMALLAEAVADGADEPDTVRRFADRLLHESQRLVALVTELLTLSRLQGADPLPELSAVEVDAVIAEAVSRTATVAENSGITVIVGNPSDRLVLGDRPMLVTALTNLIDNAVHYSPSGTSVSISTGLRDGQVEIAVTDRGIGIPAEHQDRVFERFFRVDPARSRATGGTGLGLAIVKHVAANHGGTASVWSRPGTGSTFTLRLPAHPGISAETALRGSGAQHHSSATANRGAA